jgi:hypothetical protein
LHGNFLIKHVTERKIEEITEKIGRSKPLLFDLKERRGY